MSRTGIVLQRLVGSNLWSEVEYPAQEGAFDWETMKAMVGGGSAETRLIHPEFKIIWDSEGRLNSPLTALLGMKGGTKLPLYGQFVIARMGYDREQIGVSIGLKPGDAEFIKTEFQWFDATNVAY